VTDRAAGEIIERLPSENTLLETTVCAITYIELSPRLFA
jgi:hypothetical protein